MQAQNKMIAYNTDVAMPKKSIKKVDVKSIPVDELQEMYKNDMKIYRERNVTLNIMNILIT